MSFPTCSCSAASTTTATRPTNARARQPLSPSSSISSERSRMPTAEVTTKPAAEQAPPRRQPNDPQREIERRRVEELKADGWEPKVETVHVVVNRNGVPYFTTTNAKEAEDRLVELAAGSYAAGPNVDAEP